jgi:hypothetical protein
MQMAQQELVQHKAEVEEAPAAEARLDTAVGRRQDPSTDSGSLPAAKAVEESRGEQEWIEYRPNRTVDVRIAQEAKLREEQDKAKVKAEKLAYKESIKAVEVEAAKMRKLKEEASAAEGGVDTAVGRRQDPSTDSGPLPAAKAVEETRDGAAGSTGSRITVASDGRATSGRRKGQSNS